MSNINFALSIEIQQSFPAKILRTIKGGWICSIGNDEVFLPGSQLYKKIEDYESVIGKTVTVMVQRIVGNSVVVSHKDFVSKRFERNRILQNLEKGQRLIGIIRHISDKGAYIDILGIIGYMPDKEYESDSELFVGANVEVAISKIDTEKSILLLSAKLFAKLKEKETKKQEEANRFAQRSQELENYSFDDDIKGTITKKIAKGFVVQVSEYLFAVLPYNEVPTQYRCKIGDSIEVAIFDFDYERALIYVSISKFLDKKWAKQKKIIEENVIPHETELSGKVVFIEKKLVTLSFKEEWGSFYGYIKSEDLAWEKVQSAADIVFLGEELKTKYLYDENRRLYFDLKWQQEELYPNTLFELDTEDLLFTIGVTGTEFVAKTSIISKKIPNSDDVEITSAFANNIISLAPKDNFIQLVDKYIGANITALIHPRYAYGLENGKYYRFKLKVASTERRLKEHRPYMFVAELDGSALPVSNPFKELVEKSFKENKTPKSNRESANYLKEIGADMYTDRDRMFYELLQNADDASSQKGVKVMVQIKGDYLIFTHDGLSFSRQDFKSIVSTANSTKKLDRKKTGYKGIGFKSVFTDAEKVYIKTGGFFFLFNKSAELFKDFRGFYRYVNPLYTEEQLEVFFQENDEYEKEFEGVEHLPWQLLPFWVDECPQQLLGTSFTRNCNVAIALNMGVTAEKYRNIIKGIIENPRFMLFLRNTRRIQLEEPVEDVDDKRRFNIISIAKQIDNESDTTTLKNSLDSDEREVSYIVREGNEIIVSNEAFKMCEIPIVKECKEVAGREKWYMYQIIDNLPVPITSIPERIIAADTTTISYAFMLDDKGHVTCIPNRTPSLYAYLPMEDRRYLFPFFINADFELSSNRQEAKRVSVWNEFLFYNIGKNIVSWISTIAKSTHSDYLALLPSSFFTEELEEGKLDRLAAQFNRGYKEALVETPFILNDKNDIVCQKDILIDESGFADVIGSEDFCKIWGGKKRILNKSIDITPLKNEQIFSFIEHLQSNEIVAFIISPKNRKTILRYWYGITSDLRKAIMFHIVKMPGNKKNLHDYLLDIPAYNCNGRLLSFNKLLTSNHIILRIGYIEGIEEIIEKLGFVITKDSEAEHPFHSKVEEAMDEYEIHVFEIIKNRSITNYHCLSAIEKIKLFRHFASSKINIDHEKIREWSLFCNQLDEVVPLSMLTHINSTLYNGITRRFVINEEEYNEDSHLIDRYLMKEQDQYEKIIIDNWEYLSSLINREEEFACSLYKLTSITYAVAEHEQVKGKQPYPTNVNHFVFANEQMQLLSNVIVNDTLSSNLDAKAVVALLTNKYIPSKTITKHILAEPFSCVVQYLETMTFLPKIALNKEQIDSLLNYCKNNEDTIFSKYSIDTQEEGYTLTLLPKGTTVAYTNDSALLSFIQQNCGERIKILPDEFSNYRKLKGVITDENLLLRILDEIKDVKDYLEVLLPIYKNSISLVKTSFVSHLSYIELDIDSCITQTDTSLQFMVMVSTIEKPETMLFEDLRNKIFIVSESTKNQLSKIKLEHTVEVNGKKYPLSKLLPNEDKIAKLVDTLKERIEGFTSSVFTSNLFGEEVDEGRAASVYSELNKSTVTLENGTQVAFMIDYATSVKNLNGIICKVHDSSAQPIPRLLRGFWLIQSYSFIDESCILNSKYDDLSKYVSIPFKVDGTQFDISKELVHFNHIKNTLTKQEVFDLLDTILLKKSMNQSISQNDIETIKNSLGINNSYYVISKDYSLDSENLPKDIDAWRIATNIEDRTGVLCDYFGIFGENSDVVKIRKFIDDGQPLVVSKKDSTLSNLTCKWLYQKSIMLNDSQFLCLRDIVETDTICKKDDDALGDNVSPEYRYMAFSDYSIYKHKGEIPWIAKVKSNNYIFHKYQEGDVALCGYNIFVNEEQIANIVENIRSLVNTDGFSTDDFLKFFDEYKNRLSGSFEGEDDNDLDEEARIAASELAKQEAINWLSAKGYDTTRVQTDCSFVKGVRKDEVEYHIVVKSFRSRTNELKLNPNEWLYLLKENSRLMLYMGHMTFAVIDRQMLLGNHDFLKLRISSANFSLDGNQLDDVLSRLANDIQFFERTHFVFEHIHDEILTNANSLDDYEWYKSQSNEEFTAADENDVL